MRTIHITGPAGYGKTQLIELIARAYPRAILIDGASSTTAGVEQMLRHRQSPDTVVIVDEAKADIIRMLENAQHPGRAIVAHPGAQKTAPTLRQIWRDFINLLRS